MRSKAYKELNKRAAHLYPALGGLDELSTDELRALRAVCGRLTTSNCSWVSYLLGPLLLREINAEFMRRKAAREAPKSAKKTRGGE